MSLYNVVVHFPEIQSQVFDTEVESTYVDERIKVNEAEASFAEFEACLSGQLMRKFSSNGKSCPPSSAQPLDSLLTSNNATGPTGSTVAVNRAHPPLSATSLLFGSPNAPQTMDSMNVDMPNLSELEFTGSSSTTTPAGASPLRPAGRLPPRITPASSISNRLVMDARNRNQYQASVTDALVSPTQFDVRDSSNFTNFGSLMVPISPVLPRSTDAPSFESRQSGTRFLADTEVTALDD